MNRGRGRWPRPPRNHQPRYGTPQNGPSVGKGSNNVPTIQQVQPGASVSIVLKEDQPTGREVQGVVQDLLTRGDHPRGIKVRLTDGRIGRVQRMAGQGDVLQPQATSTVTARPPPKVHRMERDVRLDEAAYPSEPPARSLAAYFPDFPSKEIGAKSVTQTVMAKCPICGVFEGDEIAVSRHIEEHDG